MRGRFSCFERAIASGTVPEKKTELAIFRFQTRDNAQMMQNVKYRYAIGRDSNRSFRTRTIHSSNSNRSKTRFVEFQSIEKCFQMSSIESQSTDEDIIDDIQRLDSHRMPQIVSSVFFHRRMRRMDV